ncbi:MAG TPA: cytochrome C oxidase subunit IV family protein [Bacteroidales bacterium]|nr:cytochrome C oxidase subunit IV family protein [Bacteroidales bacterium]HSA44840.1 cytochrome C oxidase subunit IV family protein [Bacteroidales bacterium]
MSEHKTHITSYTTHFMVLLALLILTWATVSITNINLGPYSVTAALLIACLKATLVLLYFMHLKFDSKILKISFSAVMVVFALVILLTFFDYLFR